MNFGENGVKMTTQVGKDKVECLVFPYHGDASFVNESGVMQSRKSGSTWTYVGKDENGFFHVGGQVRINADSTLSFVWTKPAGFPEPNEEMYDAFQEDIEDAEFVDEQQLVQILDKLRDEE